MNHADLYVVQLGWRESRPCAHCMAVIKAVGIKRIFYSARNGEFRAEHVTNETSADPTCHMRSLQSLEAGKTFRF